MDKFKDCIDYHNHFTTNSIRNNYRNDIKENPNFEDSISLYDYIISFANIYSVFKKDFNSLPKFNLGESFEIWDYIENEGECEATLYIYNPTIVNSDFCYLNIVEKDNEVKCFLSIDDHEYFYKMNEIKLENSFAEKYFDFIKKYHHFLECYNISKGNCMFSSKHCIILNDYEGSIYDELKSILIKVNMDFRDSYYIINIIYDLNKYCIDYNNSTIKGINGNKEEIINYLLKNLYINKERIASVYSDSEEQKVLRLKKGLDI